MSVWEYPIRVAGISFRVKHMSEIDSDNIEVEREPDNKHDKFAIKVSTVRPDGSKFHIGYIPHDMAVRIKDDKLPATGKIIWRSTDPTKPGVRIAV